MISKKLFFLCAVSLYMPFLEIIIACELFPVAGTLTYPIDGDDYFGSPVSISVLRHSTGNTPGSISPLPKPEKFNIKKQQESSTKPPAARKLNFHNLTDKEYNTDEQEHLNNKVKSLEITKKPHIAPLAKNEKELLPTYTLKSIFIQEPSTDYTQKPYPAFATTGIPFYENKTELEEAIQSLLKLLQIRTQIAKQAPELSLNNDVWRAELRNLYRKKYNFHMPYKTTVIGCHSFADITTQAQEATLNTMRCYTTNILYKNSQNI